MSDFQKRAKEMDKWCVVTRTCGNLADAMSVAQDLLRQNNYITIWPLKLAQWIVITRLPVAN